MVDADRAAEVGVVLDVHVAGEHDVVRHDRVVADDAVVRDVHVDHEQVVVAHAGVAAAVAGATVDRHVLANLVVVAHHEPGGFAAELQVLRIAADDRVRVQLVAAAKLGERTDL